MKHHKRPQQSKRYRKPSTRAGLLLPGQIRRTTTVFAPCAIERGGTLRRDIKYIIVTERLDNEWSLEIEFIDIDDQPHRLKFPTKVVQTLHRHKDQIMSTSRRMAATKGYLTAKEKGTSGLKPFEKKGEQAQ